MNDDVAKAFEKASDNAGALEQLLSENGDQDGATQADEAQIALLVAATKANAQNALQKLGTTQTNQQALKKLTENMDAKTAQLAQDEASLRKFVSIAADATGLIKAVSSVPPDVSDGIAAVQHILSTIGVG